MAVTRELIELFLAEVARFDLPVPERQPDGLFRIVMGETSVTINLENLGRDFAEDRDPSRVTHFVLQVVRAVVGETVPAWDEAAPRLRFVVEPSDYDFGSTLRATVSESVTRIVAYAQPDDAGIVWVQTSLLEAWGKTVEEVEAIASANMARFLAETEFVLDTREEGPFGFFRTNSPFKASLMLAPNFKEVVSPHLGWPLLMVIPNRDLAYVFRPDDQAMLGRMGSIVVGIYRNEAYPITTEVFRLSDDGVVAIGRFEAPPPEEIQAARDAEEGLKTIRYRGGVVNFRVPENWEEEYEEEGGGTFYDEDEPGTLRLNVLTIQTSEQTTSDATESVLRGRSKELGIALRRLPNGNCWLHYRQEADAESEFVHWFWEILCLLPPRHARLAIFSFAIETEWADHEETAEILELLNRELERCEFSQRLGE